MNSNAAVYFVDRHIDEGRADKPAFAEADGAKRSISYGNLAHQSALFAGALSRADIRRDERMAMIVLLWLHLGGSLRIWKPIKC